MIEIALISLLSIFIIRSVIIEATFMVYVFYGLVLCLGIIGIIPFVAFEFFSIPYTSGWPPVAVLVVLSIIVKLIDLRNKHTQIGLRIGINRLDWLVLFIVGILGLKACLTPIQGWDAFSLYDARARMMLSERTIGSLSVFSKYDNLNPNYYLSYPPMTSTIHAFLYGQGIENVMPIYVVYYGSILVCFVGVSRALNLHFMLRILGLAMLVFHPLLINQTSVAYTNLPHIAYQTLSVTMLVYFYRWNRLRYFLLAGLFLGFSNWVRNDPTFLSIVFGALTLVLYRIKTKSLPLWEWCFSIGLFIILVWVMRVGWSGYVTSYLGSTQLGSTSNSAGSIFWGILNSLTLTNLLSVSIFIYSAFDQIFLYLLLIIGGGLFLLDRKIRKYTSVLEVSLLVILFFNLLIFVAGTLFFSVTYDWWEGIGGSLLRSSLQMVVLSTMYVVIFMQNRWSLLLTSWQKITSP